VLLDLDRIETLGPAMHGVDTLFMLKPYSIDYLIQSKRVIDAAARAGVRHIVNLGSFGADDTPWASIGWNRLVEAYLKGTRPHDAAAELLHGQRPRASDAAADVSCTTSAPRGVWVAADVRGSPPRLAARQTSPDAFPLARGPPSEQSSRRSDRLHRRTRPGGCHYCRAVAAAAGRPRPFIGEGDRQQRPGDQ
jgi:hypothetical protein